jgi:hypothetical protein
MKYATTDGNGTWTNETVFYDAIANPGSGTPTSLQFIHFISVAALSGGGFGVCTAMENSSFCAGYYLIGGTLAPPTVSAPPVSGGAGVSDPSFTVSPSGIPAAIPGQKTPPKEHKEAPPKKKQDYAQSFEVCPLGGSVFPIAIGEECCCR